MVKPGTQTDMFASAYEAALETALADLRTIHSRVDSLKSQLSTSEARMAEVTQLIQSLLGMIPEGRRAPYTDQLIAVGLLQNIQNPRTGPVLGNVVELFRKDDGKKVWTASEVQEALADKKSPTDPKAIYNALAYLERTGRLKRVSRGQYIVTDLGFGIEIDPSIYDDKYSSPKDSEG